MKIVVFGVTISSSWGKVDVGARDGCCVALGLIGQGQPPDRAAVPLAQHRAEPPMFAARLRGEQP